MTWPATLPLTPLVIVVGVLAASVVLVLPTRSTDTGAPMRRGDAREGRIPEGRSGGPSDDPSNDPFDGTSTDRLGVDGEPEFDVLGDQPATRRRRWLPRPRPRRRGLRRPRPRRLLWRRRGEAESPTPGDVASAMALLAIAYRTGLPTWQVLTAVARTTADPVGRDLRQVATALQWGAAETEAWSSVGAPWCGAARVVSLSHAAGVAPGPLLTSASDDLNRSEIDRLEIAVAQVGVRLVAPLGLVLLPAFCLTTVVPLVVALGRQLLVG
ncbi:MAG: Type secretion system domain [Humibacillus sp.]|nr:Type secretion system domain [Humibacillus sp.]